MHVYLIFWMFAKIIGKRAQKGCFDHWNPPILLCIQDTGFLAVRFLSCSTMSDLKLSELLCPPASWLQPSRLGVNCNKNRFSVRDILRNLKVPHWPMRVYIASAATWLSWLRVQSGSPFFVHSPEDLSTFKKVLKDLVTLLVLFYLVLASMGGLVSSIKQWSISTYSISSSRSLATLLDYVAGKLLSYYQVLFRVLYLKPIICKKVKTAESSLNISLNNWYTWRH